MPARIVIGALLEPSEFLPPNRIIRLDPVNLDTLVAVVNYRRHRLRPQPPTLSVTASHIIMSPVLPDAMIITPAQEDRFLAVNS